MCGGGGSAPAPQPSTTSQIQQLPRAARPFLYGGEGYAGLLPQAYELSQQPLQLPDYMVAGRTPTQVAAEQMAREARGAYEPALGAAEALTGQGVMATEQAGRMTLQELGASQAERQAARAAMGLGLMGTTEAGLFGSDLTEAEQATRAATLFGLRGLGEAGDISRGATALGTQELGRAGDISRGATSLGMSGLRQAYGAGMDVPQAAVSAAERGISGFEGTGAEYDPEAVATYMNPYEQAVIDATMQDIARSGQLQLNEARAQAARSGAFGGARMGLAEAEIGRNILGEQARTAGRMRQEGFESAAQRSQAAFEAARARQQAAAGNIGQLGLAGVGQAASGIGQLADISATAGQLGQAGAGQLAGFGTSAAQLGQAGAGQLAGFGTSGAQLGQAGAGQLGGLRTTAAQTGMQAAGQVAGIGGNLGQLGTAYGQLGQQAAGQVAGLGQGLGALGAQMAGFGQQRQQQQLQDVNTALTIGAQQQAQQQAYLDAARQNQYQATMAPYQSLGFFSDIFQGAPTGTSAIIQQQQGAQPAPSGLSQVAGLGLAGFGLAKSGLFNT